MCPKIKNDEINVNVLRRFAEENGAVAFGWLPRCEFSEYRKEIDACAEYDFKYRSHEQFKAVATPPVSAKTLLILGVDYFVDLASESDGTRISNYSRACWSNVGLAAGKLRDFL